jgi:hypothetical protein
MEELHLPDNIKVHFAACEGQNQFLAVERLGVRYGLYTCFPFVERKVFSSGKSPIMPLRWMNDPARDIPRNICKKMKHVIQDSGLFTLMFGSRSGKKDESLINSWYDNLVEFTLAHGCPVTCVEVDCQKVLGVDKAWEFRERIKKDLPNNRIINVFHLEDGKKGIDRLIEFSDYIAISVPELRFAGKVKQVPSLARYVKNKKPSIDIHLLGCTELELLRQCSFCTSCDSTTYVGGKRYGFIKGHHISSISRQKVVELIGEDAYSYINEYNNEQNTNFLALSVELLKRDYERAAGQQN